MMNMQKFDLPDKILSKEPSVDSTVFIAPGAHIIGDVRIGSHASIWYNCVLRGDINFIQIGERTNIQDGSILHLENDRPCVVGNDVTVGHRALLHGCRIDDGVLIGMGAIILNGAHIKKGAVIGAGAVVKENMIVQAYEMVVGVPGRVVKKMPPSRLDENIKWAEKYIELARIHKERQTL